MSTERLIRTLKDYLSAKAQVEDWHAVSDAANDLRELEAIERTKDEMDKEVERLSSLLSSHSAVRGPVNSNATYLGDAVYVSRTDYHVYLEVSNGLGCTDRVVLEPSVMNAFLQWYRPSSPEVPAVEAPPVEAPTDNKPQVYKRFYNCPVDGQVEITEEEYTRQLNLANEPWACPTCKQPTGNVTTNAPDDIPF
jgi:hypothetical protein